MFFAHVALQGCPRQALLSTLRARRVQSPQAGERRSEFRCEVQHAQAERRIVISHADFALSISSLLSFLPARTAVSILSVHSLRPSEPTLCFPCVSPVFIVLSLSLSLPPSRSFSPSLALSRSLSLSRLLGVQDCRFNPGGWMPASSLTHTSRPGARILSVPKL